MRIWRRADILVRSKMGVKGATEMVRAVMRLGVAADKHVPAPSRWRWQVAPAWTSRTESAVDTAGEDSFTFARQICVEVRFSGWTE